MVEIIEIEIARCLGGPEAHGIDGLVSPAGYGRVIGHCHDLVSVDPVAVKCARCIGVLFYTAVEFDRVEVFRPLEFPGVSVAEPVVRRFHLYPPDDLLEEYPVFVPDAIPVCRKPQRRHRVKEAGRQAAQAAVPQSRVPLRLAQLFKVVSELHERAVSVIIQAGVHEAVPQGPSHEELQRQVIDPLGVVPVIGLLRLYPPLDQAIPCEEGDALVFVVDGRGELVLREGIFQVMDIGLFQRLDVPPFVRICRSCEFVSSGFFLRHGPPLSVNCIARRRPLQALFPGLPEFYLKCRYCKEIF